jgi:hypothetical protein
LRHLLDLFAQGLGAWPLDLESREGGYAEPDRAPVENRPIAQDEARLFHPPDAAQARRRREPNRLGQFSVGEPTIALKCGQNVTIYRVEFDSWHDWPLLVGISI